MPTVPDKVVQTNESFPPGIKFAFCKKVIKQNYCTIVAILQKNHDIIIEPS